MTETVLAMHFKDKTIFFLKKIFQLCNKNEDLFLKWFTLAFTHEQIHKILEKIENEDVSRKFDAIPQWIFYELFDFDGKVVRFLEINKEFTIVDTDDDVLAIKIALNQLSSEEKDKLKFTEVHVYPIKICWSLYGEEL
jgi:hypothetical protein